MTLPQIASRRIHYAALFVLSCLLIVGTAGDTFAQKPAASGSSSVPPNILLRIVRAEDERRWDADLSGLLSAGNAAVRARSALAAGRIGDERAVPSLVALLQNDKDENVRTMGAFALGETESPAAGDALIAELTKNGPARERGRIVEALGKITAALPTTDETRLKAFRREIYAVLEIESKRRSAADTEVILLGLTAALRARPDGAGKLIAEFLTYNDSRIRADAANALARLRANDGNEQLRKLLTADPDPIVRANAARVLGATGDKASLDALADRMLKDVDRRVRVSAIRALSSLKEPRAADNLLELGMSILEKSPSLGSRENELVEVATALGSLKSKSKDPYVASWLRDLRSTLKVQSPEVEVALASVDPAEYVRQAPKVFLHYKLDGASDTAKGRQVSVGAQWRHVTNLARGLGEVARLICQNEKENAQVCAEAQGILLETIAETSGLTFYEDKDVPEVMRAYAAFKPEELRTFLEFQLGLEPTDDTPTNNKRKRVLVALDDPLIKGRYASTKYMTPPDIMISATAAELLAELPPNENTTQWLFESLHFSLRETTNDAALAILDALAKQKSSVANDAIKLALDSPDHLVRRRAVALLKTNGVGDFSNRIGNVKTVNTEVDYRRAIARIGRQNRATIETNRGSFTIELLPDHAPLTVDNFVQLARRGYFKGIAFHRVVPNFVIQGGDPRGDGNGGPDYSIRCEVNQVPYERGALGMALSGKDTGGSQWFVTHSPQPHLDGGYTVFGRVISGMDVVDQITRGDVIRTIVITEGRRTASANR